MNLILKFVGKETNVTLCQIKSIRMLRGPTLFLARAPHCGGQSTRGHQPLPAHTGPSCLKPSQCRGGARVRGSQIPALVPDPMLPGGVLQVTGGGLLNPGSPGQAEDHQTGPTQPE